MNIYLNGCPTLAYFEKKNMIHALKIIKHPYPYGKPPQSKNIKHLPYEDEDGRIIIPDPDFVEYKDDVNDEILIDDVSNKKLPSQPIKKIPNKKLPPIRKEPKKPQATKIKRS